MAPRLAAALALLLVWLVGGAGQAQEPRPFLSEVGEWLPEEPGAFVTGIARAGSLAFALEQGALHVLDVADPARPTRRARVDLGGARGWPALAATATTLLVFQQPTLRVFDTSDPNQPRQVGSYTSPVGDCGGWEVSTAIAIVGERVYLALGPAVTSASCTGSLTILDLANPGAPVELGSLSGIGPAGALRVAGTTAYIAESGPASSRFSRGFGQIRVVDVADPARPRQVGALQSSMTLLPGLALIGRYAYITGGHTCFGGFSCHFGAAIEIVDVGDPTRPTLAATIATAFGNDLETAGRYLFLAEARSVGYPFGRVGCLRVFDTANPIAPVEVAATGVVQRDNDVALDASHAYVADGESVRVLSWVGPPPPTPAPLPTPGQYRVLLPYVLDGVGCDPG